MSRTFAATGWEGAMNRTGAVLMLLALGSVSCATAPPLHSVPSNSSQLSASTSSSAADAARYRAALEEAYAQIVARSEGSVPLPLVDVDAGLSMEIPDHKAIRGALSYFSTDLHESIQTSLDRSRKYKKKIDSVLAEYKLPKGLAYLPVIESAYVETLTSRSGAHGVWQFMPDTAREYGLRVDWWVDERADFDKATRAAAAYLRDLYGQFHDWPLTLAAYNAGPGRIRRALDENGAKDFWQLLEAGAVPKETRGYVPTFFATLMIANDPAAYGFQLSEPEHSGEEERRVEIEGPVSLRYVAEAGNIDETLLRRLNPSLRRGVVPPGRCAIRVPAQAASIVAQRATTLRSEDARIALTVFTVRPGDSLADLAEAIGTSTEVLSQMNSLRGGSLHEGQTIYLPVRERELASLLNDEDDDSYYAVAKGDTIYSIARSHGLSVEELIDLNQLDAGEKLRVGQKLRTATRMPLAAGGM
jgi:membrane-bound lytic murein transglycosylase D